VGKSHSDHALAGCIGSRTDALAQNSDAAIAALVALVEEFVLPEQVHKMTEYLLQPERDVYLGHLAPTSIN
jgi:hypothetical protein